MMKKLFSALISLSIALSSSAPAQDKTSTQSFSQLKRDYKQVEIVAHVKIKGVKFAATDVHPLYVVRSEILEAFKGSIKRGQQLEFYFHAEEEFDASGLVGDEWVIFLEGRYPVPAGGKGWYELENSKLHPSQMNIARMRRIKYTSKRSRKSRG